MPLGMEVGLGQGDFSAKATVLDGVPAPPKKGGTSPNFWHVCCGQTAGSIKMPLGTEVGLGPGVIVLHPIPQKRVHSSPFSAHVYCGHMARWIKMPLGREIGLSLGDIVLDGDPAAPKRGHSPSQFLAHVYCE